MATTAVIVQFFRTFPPSTQYPAGELAGARYEVASAAIASLVYPDAIILSYADGSAYPGAPVFASTVAPTVDNSNVALRAAVRAVTPQTPGGVVVGGANGPREVPVEHVDVLHPDYGVTGDGVALDTDGLRAAVAAAGPNGTVFFPPNRTFLLAGALTPLAGQTWIGYGATLKRCDAISTTTTTAITTSGNQTVAVANAGAFRVGMDVAVVNGGNYETTTHRVLGIAGNQLSLGTFFATPFPVGSTLFTSFTQVVGTADQVTLLGLTFDGNRAANAIVQRWETNDGIYLTTNRGVVRDCYLHDAQADGIIIDGDNAEVAGCFILNCQGNGVHLGQSSHARVVGNYVKNCNLSGTATGHADGCIIASNLVGDAYVAGNYCENGIAGIGSWDSDDDSNLICVGNTIRNCTSYALDMVTPTGTTCGKVIFAHNQVFNSGSIELNQTDSAAPADVGSYRVLIAHNYVEDTTIDLVRCYDVSVVGNVVHRLSPTAGIGVSVFGGVGLLIAQNAVRNGQYGIYLDGATRRDILVVANRCKDQYTTAILDNAAAAGNERVADNLVSAGAGVSAGYAGIIAANGTVVDGNQIDVGANTVGQYGILCPNGGAGVGGAVVTNNVVRSPANVPSVRTFGGSQNNVIKGNYIQQAVSNGGGASNTVTDNTTIL